MPKLSDTFLHLLGTALETPGNVLQTLTEMTPAGRSARAEYDLAKQQQDENLNESRQIQARQNINTLASLNASNNAQPPDFIGPHPQGSFQVPPNQASLVGITPGTTFEPVQQSVLSREPNAKTGQFANVVTPLDRGQTFKEVSKDPFDSASRMRLGEQTDQFNERRWERLGTAVNALTAGSRKALGAAATANMRSDRALETLSDPKATPQDLFNVVSDIQGIYKNGAPDEMSLKYGQYKNLWSDLANIGTYLSGNPAPAEVPKIQERLKRVVLGLKAVDNKVIDDNLGINKVIFRPLIKGDPGRWADLVSSVNQSTIGASQAPPLLGQGMGGAQPQASPMIGETIRVRNKQTGVTGSMPKATFNPSLYDPIQ